MFLKVFYYDILTIEDILKSKDTYTFKHPIKSIPIL